MSGSTDKRLLTPAEIAEALSISLKQALRLIRSSMRHVEVSARVIRVASPTGRLSTTAGLGIGAVTPLDAPTSAPPPSGFASESERFTIRPTQPRTRPRPRTNPATR